jgi:hypothetical protein
MSSADGIHTLANVVITYYTQVYLILKVASFCEVVTIMKTQANEGLYHDQYLNVCVSSFCYKGF